MSILFTTSLVGLVYKIYYITYKITTNVQLLFPTKKIYPIKIVKSFTLSKTIIFVLIFILKFGDLICSCAKVRKMKTKGRHIEFWFCFAKTMIKIYLKYLYMKLWFKHEVSGLNFMLCSWCNLCPNFRRFRLY